MATRTEDVSRYAMIIKCAQEIAAMQKNAIDKALERHNALNKKKSASKLNSAEKIEFAKVSALLEAIIVLDQDVLVAQIEEELQSNYDNLQENLDIIKSNHERALNKTLHTRAVLAKLGYDYLKRGLYAPGEKPSIVKAIKERDSKGLKDAVKYLASIKWHHVWSDIKYFLDYKNASKARIVFVIATIAAAIIAVSSRALTGLGFIVPGTLSATILSAIAYGNLIYAVGLFLFAAIEIGRIFHLQLRYYNKKGQVAQKFGGSHLQWLDSVEHLTQEDKNLRAALIKHLSLDDALKHPEAIRALFTQDEFNNIIKPQLIKHARSNKNKALAMHGISAVVFTTIAVLAIAAFIAPQVATPLALAMVLTLVVGIGLKMLLGATVLKKKPHIHITGIASDSGSDSGSDLGLGFDTGHSLVADWIPVPGQAITVLGQASSVSSVGSVRAPGQLVARELASQRAASGQESSRGPVSFRDYPCIPAPLLEPVSDSSSPSMSSTQW